LWVSDSRAALAFWDEDDCFLEHLLPGFVGEGLDEAFVGGLVLLDGEGGVGVLDGGGVGSFRLGLVLGCCLID